MWIPDIRKLKNLVKTISSKKNCFVAILREKKWIPAIRTTKNVVLNSLEKVKRG